MCSSVAGSYTGACCCAGWVPGRADAKALYGLLTSSWLNLLLLAVPIGWACHFAHVNSVAVFVTVSLQHGLTALRRLEQSGPVE